MNFVDPKDLPKDEGALYAQVQALLHQQQQQAVAAQQIQVKSINIETKIQMLRGNSHSYVSIYNWDQSCKTCGGRPAITDFSIVYEKSSSSTRTCPASLERVAMAIGALQCFFLRIA